MSAYVPVVMRRLGRKEEDGGWMKEEGGGTSLGLFALLRVLVLVNRVEWVRKRGRTCD